MDMEQLQKDLDEAGIDPETGEVSLTNEGDDDVTSETDRIEEEAELGEADSGEPEGSEPEGSGDDSKTDSELSEQELEALEGIDEGKGMVEIPASVLKKLKKQKKEALDERDEARQSIEEQRNATLQSQIDSKDQIINQMVQQAQPEEVDKEPDKVMDPEEWTDWRLRQQDKQISDLTTAVTQTSQVANMQTAQNTLGQMEEVYGSVNPDFKGKKEQYIKAIAASLRISQPGSTPEQRLQWANEEFVYQANGMQQGTNIMETFNSIFDEMGIATKEEVKAKSDLKSASENAKKNKTLSNKGAKTSPSAGQILPTQEEYLNMNKQQVKDWKKKHKIKDKAWKAHTLKLANEAARDDSGGGRYVLMG